MLTSDGEMYMVKTSATTCEECWAEMKRTGYLSVEVTKNTDQKDHLIHAGLVREMFLGTRHFEE